jgi:hypothetical protein
MPLWKWRDSRQLLSLSGIALQLLHFQQPGQDNSIVVDDAVGEQPAAFWSAY